MANPLENLSVESLILYASTCTGLAVVLASGFLVAYLAAPRADREDLGVFESIRRSKLREGSQLYRWFEPAVHQLEGLLAGTPEDMVKFRRNLTLSGVTLPWKAEEYLAAKFIESILVGLSLFAIMVPLTESVAIGFVVGLVSWWGYYGLVRQQVRKRAQAKLESLRRRLPFVMDLMSLAMEAGATFLESVQIVVQENGDHPIAEQFAEVLRDVAVGRTRREALESLQQRLGDDDFNEIVFAIIKGEELGTPLSQILRNLADQMRLKRSQWAEKAAAEAQVNIVFPGLVVMVACLLVVVAPFVLGALNVKSGD